MELNYLTEEEAKMPLDLVLSQITMGIQMCSIKSEVVEILKDVYELGRRAGEDRLKVRILEAKFPLKN